MPNSQHRYEVYIKYASPMILAGAGAAKWSWCRLNHSGFAVAQGALHNSLSACFTAVREHLARHGDAPIAVNLGPVNERYAANVVGFPESEGEPATQPQPQRRALP